MFFTRDGGSGIIEDFKVDEAINPVPLRKARNRLNAVFIGPSNQIAGDADAVDRHAEAAALAAHADVAEHRDLQPAADAEPLDQRHGRMPAFGDGAQFGLSILLIEQDARSALGIADYGYIMEGGRIVYEGPPEKLLDHKDVQEFYLGSGDSARTSYREVKQYRRSRRWWG